MRCKENNTNLLIYYFDQYKNYLVGRDLKTVSLVCYDFHLSAQKIKNKNLFYRIPINHNVIIASPEKVKVWSTESIPPSAKHVTFRDKFNSSVDSLSPSILKIDLCDFFTLSIDSLPPFLTHLSIGSRFNQPIDNLPSSLQYLKLNDSFNHPIDYLPSSLTHLAIGMKFNHPIDNLPPSLQLLYLKSDFFFQPLDCLPHSLTHLIIHRYGNNNLELNNLPPSLTHLFLAEYNKLLNRLPSSLTHLYVGRYRPEEREILDNLPLSLSHLVLDFQFNHPIEFPSSVQYLQLGESFNQPIHSLPNTLKKFHIGKLTSFKYKELFPFPTQEDWHNMFDLYIPKKITYPLFTVNFMFQNPLPILPDSLTELYVGTTVDNITLPPTIPSDLSIYILSPTVIESNSGWMQHKIVKLNTNK